MSELVLVFGVVALTTGVLIWLLFVVQKWLKLREQFMPRFEEAPANAAPRLQRLDLKPGAPFAARRNSVPERHRQASKAAA